MAWKLAELTGLRVRRSEHEARIVANAFLSGRAQAVVFCAGLSLLLTALVAPQLRLQLLQAHLLSPIILSLLLLCFTPARIWPLALGASAAIWWALSAAMAFRERVEGFPVTFVDVIMNLQEPHIVFRALGYRGSITFVALTGFLLFVLAVLGALRLFGAPSRRSLLLRITGFLAAAAISILSLASAARDMSGPIAASSPELAQQTSEAAGQAELERRTGPLEYLAYSYLVGDDLLLQAPVRAPALPEAELESTVRQQLRLPAGGLLPNIVIYHAESTFDPNIVFRLSKRVDLPLWSPIAQTQSIGGLAVNVVGGGTQVTEFEVLTGVDSRQFGTQGFYANRFIAPHVRRAFPGFLAAKGYETSAFYTESSGYYGVGDGFRHFGVSRFTDSQELGLSADWTDTDRLIVGRIVSKGAFKAKTRPQFVYINTLENHGPHPCTHFHDARQFATTLQGNRDFARDCSLNEYLLRARSTSAAMLTVLKHLQRLEVETGRPFVLLVYGDHQPWSFTDGDFSVSFGTVNSGDMASFSAFRKGDTRYLTMYHLLSSVPGVVPRSFPAPVPATLLPTLLSAYVARNTDDLYLPVNLLAFSRCGADFRARNCPLRQAMDAWTRGFLFTP